MGVGKFKEDEEMGVGRKHPAEMEEVTSFCQNSSRHISFKYYKFRQILKLGNHTVAMSYKICVANVK